MQHLTRIKASVKYECMPQASERVRARTNLQNLAQVKEIIKTHLKQKHTQ